MLPNDIINLIYEYKLSYLVYNINKCIKMIGKKNNKPHIITLTPANEDNPSIGIVFNTKNIIGVTYTNHQLNRDIFKHYTYFCSNCGDILEYYHLMDTFFCNCDDYEITRY